LENRKGQRQAGGYMADNTGTEALFPILEGFCREHRAMCALLQEDNPRWRQDVRRVSDSKPYRDAIRNQFRVVRENQQTSPDNAIDVGLLIEALSKTTL
jgi:hypothetical protein